MLIYTTAPYTVCEGCGQVDPDMVTVDFGIGYYEYWGAPGFHSDEHVVTRCCECQPVEFWPVPDEEPLDLIPEDAVVDTTEVAALYLFDGALSASAESCQ